MAERVDDAEEAGADEHGQFVGEGRVWRGRDVPLPLTVVVAAKSRTDARGGDQRGRVVYGAFFGGCLDDVSGALAEVVHLAEVVVGGLVAVGEGVGPDALVLEESS